MHIYILTHPKFEGWIKLGRSINLPQRIQQYQSCCPDRAFKIEYSVKTEYCYNIENYFDNFIENNGFEWFKCSVDFAKKSISQILNKIEQDPSYLKKGSPTEMRQYILKKNKNTVKFDYLVDGKVLKGLTELSNYIGITQSTIACRKKKNKGNSILNINGFEIITVKHEN